MKRSVADVERSPAARLNGLEARRRNRRWVIDAAIGSLLVLLPFLAWLFSR